MGNPVLSAQLSKGSALAWLASQIPITTNIRREERRKKKEERKKKKEERRKKPLGVFLLVLV